MQPDIWNPGKSLDTLSTGGLDLRLTLYGQLPQTGLHLLLDGLRFLVVFLSCRGPSSNDVFPYVGIEELGKLTILPRLKESPDRRR